MSSWARTHAPPAQRPTPRCALPPLTRAPPPPFSGAATKASGKAAGVAANDLLPDGSGRDLHAKARGELAGKLGAAVSCRAVPALLTPLAALAARRSATPRRVSPAVLCAALDRLAVSTTMVELADGTVVSEHKAKKRNLEVVKERGSAASVAGKLGAAMSCCARPALLTPLGGVPTTKLEGGR